MDKLFLISYGWVIIIDVELCDFLIGVYLVSDGLCCMMIVYWLVIGMFICGFYYIFLCFNNLVCISILLILMEYDIFKVL